MILLIVRTIVPMSTLLCKTQINYGNNIRVDWYYNMSR